ncbi:hypothetical protein ACJMK2_025669 [Sinanodonta woodiana]|uniref:Ig-like domain-containing protein n=1 Tax=Sinanodonta woodiana TaxID=1069815 RepID=A0ABD3XH91_SINWO
MSNSRHCCILLLVLGGLHLVTGYVSISECNGESATLFRDISFKSDMTMFTLYKNGDNNIVLAVFSKQNSDLVNETYQNGYGKKLSLENGTIRIHNLSKSDEGKYILQPALGSLSMKIEVDLVVLVEPPTQCKPKIERVKNTLVASLDIEDCDNSPARVSWYKFGASNISRPEHKLNDTWDHKLKDKSMIVIGEEAYTYCACAENLSMYCVRKLDRFDFCSCLITEKGASTSRNPELPKDKEPVIDQTKRSEDAVYTESNTNGLRAPQSHRWYSLLNTRPRSSNLLQDSFASF